MGLDFVPISLKPIGPGIAPGNRIGVGRAEATSRSMIRIPPMRFSLTYWDLDLGTFEVRLRNRRARLPVISTRGLAVRWAGSRHDSAVGQAMDLQTPDSRHDLDVGMTSTSSDGPDELAVAARRGGPVSDP